LSVLLLAVYSTSSPAGIFEMVFKQGKYTMFFCFTEAIYQ